MSLEPVAQFAQSYEMLSHHSNNSTELAIKTFFSLQTNKKNTIRIIPFRKSAFKLFVSSLCFLTVFVFLWVI